MAKETTIEEQSRDAVRNWHATRDGKHKKSREIESDIDQTRYAMDRTMNEIGNRFHPRSMVDHLLDYFQKPEHREQVSHAARETGLTVMDSVRRNPGPALLIGGGILWSIVNQRKEEREPGYAYGPEGSYVDARTGEAYPTDRETGESFRYSEGGGQEGAGLSEKAEGVAQRARESAGGAAEKLREKGQDLKESAQHAASRAAGQAGEAIGRQKGHLRHAGGRAGRSAGQGLSAARSEAQHRVSQGAGQAGKMARQYPVPVGLGALALGVLAGGLVPKTHAEEKVSSES